MWNDPRVQAIISRDYWRIERKRDSWREWWIVEAVEDGFQGHRVTEFGETLEQACGLMLERLAGVDHVA